MKSVVSIMFGLICLSYATLSIAQTNLYTFQGSINYIEIDGAYYSDVDFDDDYTTENDTFRVGETLEYVFKVDFDLAGFCEGPSGTTYSDTCTGVEILDSETANYFFAELYSASKLAPATEEGTTFNYGLSVTNVGWLIGDTAVFVISPYNQPVETWTAKTDTEAGSMLIGIDAWAGANGTSPYGRINSTLELVSIVPFEEKRKKVKKNTKCFKNKGNKGKKHKWRKFCL